MTMFWNYLGPWRLRTSSKFTALGNCFFSSFSGCFCG